MNLLTKKKLTHRLCEQAYGCQREALGEGIVWKFWMGMYILLHLKWKPTGTYTWKSSQCYVAAWIRGEFRREWIHLYGWLSPFAVHQKLSQ